LQSLEAGLKQMSGTLRCNNSNLVLENLMMNPLPCHRQAIHFLAALQHQFEILTIKTADNDRQRPTMKTPMFSMPSYRIKRLSLYVTLMNILSRHFTNMQALFANSPRVLAAKKRKLITWGFGRSANQGYGLCGPNS
jgi:hypothetical protein